MSSRVSPLIALTLGLAGGSCKPAYEFSRDISALEFRDLVVSSPKRVKVKLRDDSLVARDVKVEKEGKLGHDERIHGRATEIAVVEKQAVLTLEPGIQVSFDEKTRLLGEEEENDMTFDDFVARVTSEIQAGHRASVRARRAPPAEPQAPDDATFRADALSLDRGADPARFELNIDADNLEMNGAPPPDGWVKVLGLLIEIRQSEGLTRLREAREDLQGEVKFGGRVASADAAAGTVTLEDGAVVRVVEGTEIEGADGGERHGDDGRDNGDDAEHSDGLASVAAVADALAAGLAVEARGEGVVESTNPTTIAAIEVEFEVRDKETADDRGEAGEGEGEIEFEGMVTSADAAAWTFTLADGTVVRVVEGTEIRAEDGAPPTLRDLAAVLAAGVAVHAEGRGVAEAANPLTVVAARVEWRVGESAH